MLLSLLSTLLCADELFAKRRMNENIQQQFILSLLAMCVFFKNKTIFKTSAHVEFDFSLFFPLEAGKKEKCV